MCVVDNRGSVKPFLWLTNIRLLSLWRRFPRPRTPHCIRIHSLTGDCLNWSGHQLSHWVLCSCLQPSSASTLWSRAETRTTGPQLKKATTVSQHKLIDVMWIRQPDFCLLVRRRDQRREDGPSVRRTSESDKRGRNAAENKEQRQLLNRGQPQQHQGAQKSQIRSNKQMPSYICCRGNLNRCFPPPPTRTFRFPH